MAEIVGLTVNTKTKQLQLIGALGVGKLQEKTVAATEKEQVITADYNYYGLKSVTVEAVPVRQNAELFGVFDDPEYIVQGETLTDIADAIREKRKSTAIFTPLQMPDEIRGISGAEDMPNAEDAHFGTVDAEKEYGVYSFSETYTGKSGSYELGNTFTANDNFAVSGFRYRARIVGGDHKITLWDSETQNGIATAIFNVSDSEVDQWKEVMLPSPVNVESWKTYIIGVHRVESSLLYYTVQKSECAINPKITLGRSQRASEKDVFPTIAMFDSSAEIVAIDIIIDDTLTESVVTEYKIQKETLDKLSDAVKAQTGKVGMLSPDEMIAALTTTG